ncbi:hypothetical protein GIY56_02040 [Paracoccus sp. YIM 132242]|uniref:Uncharacterized protein n=1 Tax=Paracoccus lichenicola TaxID=2665644 RepID=A0A6L6HIS9_9RHOB|nr:hypothetical protein [Paracoccus lichenicola]MTD99063.1 hypothetical protein [Paracoccus lichenicola]
MPTYSPAYPTALTRKGLLPGEVREVLQGLPYSLARCIRQYQLHGEPPRRTSAARLAELQAEANRLAGCLGWIDVRKLDAHELHCIVQTCSSPAAGRMVLHLVLSHAARQGVIPRQRLRACIPARSKTRANSAPDRQWSEQDWQTFRHEHPKGTVERVAAVLMVHLGTSWQELCQMPGDELMARIENQPHPELRGDVGGLDFSAGMQFWDMRAGWRIPNPRLHDAVWFGSIECSLWFFHQRVLRQLFYRRAADCGLALLQRRAAAPVVPIRHPAAIHLPQSVRAAVWPAQDLPEAS